MVKKLNFLFFLCVLSSILLSQSIIVYAAPFEVNAVPLIDSIAVNEAAKYRIEIKNNLATNQEFRIYTLNYPFWDIRTEPLVKPITLEVAPKSEKGIEIFIDPLHTTQVGAYAVNVNIRSINTDEVLTVPLEVSIKSTDPLIGEYIPTVLTSVSVPEKIDPRKEIPITINLNNQNIIDYQDMIIKIESNLITDSIPYKLGPREEKILILTEKIGPFTAPQKDKLVVTVFKGERRVVSPIAKPIEIIEYGSLDEVETKKGFLRTKKEFLFTSNNKDYEGKAKIETTFFKALFTSTSPRAKSIVEDGKRYLQWEIKLHDTNSLRLTATENLLPLLIIALLIIFLIVLYYGFRSPLVIRKEAKSIKIMHGGICELKVVLHLRNRGSKPLKEIDITERVPHMVNVEKEVSIGTMHPEKILRHENKDTIIKWSLDSLEPNEERVLSYRVSSRLPILGHLTLHAAGSKFKYNEKASIASSNRLEV